MQTLAGAIEQNIYETPMTLKDAKTCWEIQ